VVEHDPTDPVDLTTGKMYLPQTDVVLPGALPLVFRRRVESGYHYGRWFGPSWSSTLDQRLEIDAEGVVLVTEDGLLLTYPHPAPGLPTLPSHGPRWPLDRENGGYMVTDPTTHRVWHFADRTDDLAVLEQIDDRNGNWITFEYDAGGTPLAVISSGGYHVRVTTEASRVTALHLAATGEELKRYAYTDGHLTEVINSSGRPLRFTYDESGRLTSWTDTNNRGYTYEYDDQDRCVAEGGTHGHMTLRLSYDETDPETGLRVTTTTTAEGHTRRYVVNDACQIVVETDPLGAVTRFERDRYHRLLSRYHRLLSRTNPLGHRSTFYYDESGNLLTLTCPDGREARAEYNELGLPVKVVNSDGTVVRQTYDDRGNRTSVTAPSGRTTHFTHNNAGHVTSVTDPLGHTTTIVCDRAGLPLQITDPPGATTRYERDAFGRPVTVTDPTGAVTRLEWTVEGHLARRTAADGSTESWTYDGEGNCTIHTDPVGGVSRFEYTHFDLLTARRGPDGVRYDFDHDLELRLTKVTSPQGLTWNYEYDAAGRLITETDFDDRTLTYTYDPADRLASRRNALGGVRRFDRNELGQVIRKDAAGRVTTYAYDMTDQLAEAIGPDDTRLTLLRDRFGRLRSETVDGRTLTYTYDEMGRRTGRTTPTGATTTWSYDAAGRRTGMVASGRSIDITYDPAGRELTRRIGETVTLEHTFDPLGRLTTLVGDGHRRPCRATPLLHLPRRRQPDRYRRPPLGLPPLRPGRDGPGDGGSRGELVGDVRLRRGRQPDDGTLAVLTPRRGRNRPPRLRGHPHHPSRQHSLRTRRPRPDHPAPEDPPVPQGGHLALRMGRGGPPHVGYDSGRHALALHVRPPGPPYGETPPGGRRRNGRRARELHLGRHDPVRTDRHVHRSTQPSHPDVGPPGPAPRRPDRAHHGRRRTTGGDRLPLLLHRHRPDRHADRAGRRTRRLGLANTQHPVGRHLMGREQHHLHTPPLPRPVLRPGNGPALQLLPPLRPRKRPVPYPPIRSGSSQRPTRPPMFVIHTENLIHSDLLLNVLVARMGAGLTISGSRIRTIRPTKERPQS